MDRKGKVLFALPDGSSLKYAPPFQTGPLKKWFRSYDLPDVWTAAKKPKGQQYRVNLWSSGTSIVVVAADFDKLPDEFHSFDALYEYLKWVFPLDRAIITRTPSNKVKAFFALQLPGGVS